jgi:hypothetical protein
MLHLDALRLCRSRTSVSSTHSPVSCVRPGWPPGTALARRAVHLPRQRIPQRMGMPGVQVDHLLSALQPEADGTVTFGVALLMRDHKDQRVVRMVSDSDPRTVAEYVTQCPKIFVR